MKEGLNIRKSFHRINYISRSNEENKVIISINIKKAFGKNNMNKTEYKLQVKYKQKF